MNIFEQLKDIINIKQNLLAEDLDDEGDFVPYLTQRWLSMYSPSFAQITNITSNQLWRAMEDKQMWYKLFTSVIPKSNIKKIRYIKKLKKTSVKTPEIQLIEYLANEMEISKREIKLYIEQEGIDLKQIKKELNI